MDKQLHEVERLLGLKDIADAESKKVIVKRIGLEMELKPLSPSAFDSYIEEVEGMEEYEAQALLVTKSCVSPDFNNPEFLKAAKCSFGWQFLMRKLLPGEIKGLFDAVKEISGYTDEAIDKSDKVKNS